MSLVGKVESWLKKNAAAIAFNFYGYDVVRVGGSVQIYEGSFEFCRLQHSRYSVVNDSPATKKNNLIAYILDRKERPNAYRVLSVLRIDVEYPAHFVSPNGISDIVD